MAVSQGDVWWADLPAPIGSAPGFHRPLVVVQGDRFNRSRIRTALCVPLTTNLRLATMPGNVLVTTGATGLPSDSVANVSQFFAVDLAYLSDRIGRIPDSQLQLILAGIDLFLAPE